jgi:dTDP-4-dehydrorhamnose reductase
MVRAVEPGRSDEFPAPAARPLFSALDCTRFEKTFELGLPPWHSTLELAMAE